MLVSLEGILRGVQAEKCEIFRKWRRTIEMQANGPLLQETIVLHDISGKDLHV